MLSEWLIVFLVAPFVIGMVGSLVKARVLGPKAGWPDGGTGFTGFRKFYFVTLGWHPLIAGCVTGLIGHWLGIPTPAAFGGGYAGTVLAYTFAGGVASIGYDTIVKTIKRMIGSIGGNVADGRGSEGGSVTEPTPEDLGEDP